MRAYEIGNGGYLGGVMEDVQPLDAIPRRWTRTVPPDPGDGEYVVWQGRGWRLTTIPYALPVEHDPAPTADERQAALLDTLATEWKDAAASLRDSAPGKAADALDRAAVAANAAADGLRT